MADYKHAAENGVIRLADGAAIPNDMGNRDWVEYQAYVAGGGLTDPWKTQAELDQDAYDEELNKTTGEQNKVNETLQLNSVWTGNSWATLTPEQEADVIAYGTALDTHRAAVITAGPGGAFPTFPEYKPGEPMPNFYSQVYGG